MLTAASLTATDVARELGISHATASYHLRQLEQAGLVVAFEGDIIRGGRERRYRQHVPDDQFSPRATWTGADLRMVIEALHAELTRRVINPVHGSNAVIDGEFWVPPEVWEQARAQIRAASELLYQAATPAGTPGAAHVSLTALLFQIAEDREADDGP